MAYMNSACRSNVSTSNWIYNFCHACYAHGLQMLTISGPYASSLDGLSGCKVASRCEQGGQGSVCNNWMPACPINDALTFKWGKC